MQEISTWKACCGPVGAQTARSVFQGLSAFLLNMQNENNLPGCKPEKPTVFPCWRRGLFCCWFIISWSLQVSRWRWFLLLVLALCINSHKWLRRHVSTSTWATHTDAIKYKKRHVSTVWIWEEVGNIWTEMTSVSSQWILREQRSSSINNHTIH